MLLYRLFELWWHIQCTPTASIMVLDVEGGLVNEMEKKKTPSSTTLLLRHPNGYPTIILLVYCLVSTPFFMDVNGYSKSYNYLALACPCFWYTYELLICPCISLSFCLSFFSCSWFCWCSHHQCCTWSSYLSAYEHVSNHHGCKTGSTHTLIVGYSHLHFTGIVVFHLVAPIEVDQYVEYIQDHET